MRYCLFQVSSWTPYSLTNVVGAHALTERTSGTACNSEKLWNSMWLDSWPNLLFAFYFFFFTAALIPTIETTITFIYKVGLFQWESKWEWKISFFFFAFYKINYCYFSLFYWFCVFIIAILARSSHFLTFCCSILRKNCNNLRRNHLCTNKLTP